MKLKTQKSYKQGDFVANLDDAHNLIREMESELGDPPSDFGGNLMNIDVCNEELERLSKRLSAGGSPTATAKPAAKASAAISRPAAQRFPNSFVSGSGISKLASAIEKTNKPR